MKKTSSISLSLLSTALLAGTALVGPQIAAAATTDLQAQTGWAISRVASVSRGSYCAMAQKFGANTVMTIAKNDKSEYSLAFDFQAPKFSLDKELTASVKAGAGVAQTFAVRPQSPQVVVISLGPDEGFMSDLKKSGKVMLDINGDSYTFNTEKFADAQDEMATCMSSMKMQTRQAQATPQTAIAEEAKEKSAAAPAQPPVQALAAAPKASGDQLSAEDLVAAPIDAPAAPAQPQLKADTSSKATQAAANTRQAYENDVSSRSGPAVAELQEKISVLSQENAKLKADLNTVATSSQNKQDLARIAGELDKTKAELAKASEQNKTLQTQLATSGKSAQDLQLAQRETDALKAENQTLKNQLQIAAGAGSKESSAQAATLTKLQQENVALKAELNNAQQQAATVAANPMAEKELVSLRAEKESLLKELADAQKSTGAPDEQLTALKAENENLKDRLAQATIEPAGADKSGDQDALRAQMRDMKAQLELAESESAGLRKQIDNLQKETEGGQLKMAGGNWDLEQATRRYQESQREIRRLGALLEQDRVKCTEEKKNIEYMLFDPEVAKPAQISMLGNLEDQINQKDARIAELEQALKSAGVQPASGDSRAVIASRNQPSITPEQVLSADATSTEPDRVANVEDLPVPTPAPAKVAPAPKIQAQPLPVPVAAVPMPAAQPAPQKVAASSPPVPAPVAPAAVGFQSEQDFASLLKAAGIGIRGNVEPLKGQASGSAYSWQTDSLYGSAEQRTMPNRENFEPSVQQYVARAKSRCTGEFAAVPAQIRLIGANMAEGYEIACVNGQSGSSASVLFSYRNGVMTTIAHEGRAEAMDIAMDARDKIAAKIITN